MDKKISLYKCQLDEFEMEEATNMPSKSPPQEVAPLNSNSLQLETIPEEITIFRLLQHGKPKPLILRAKSTLEMHEWLNALLSHKILAEQIIMGEV